MQKPNILFVTTDQQRADHLGVKGLRAIQTPHLDRLAHEGVHFDRAYCPSPICTPTRVSLLTGQYPSRHRAWSIGVTLDPFPTQTLGSIFSENGYATALFGKTHFVSRIDEVDHVIGGKASPENYRTFKGPYAGFQEIRSLASHTINGSPDMHYRNFLETLGVDFERWFPFGKPQYDHYRCGSWDLPEEMHYTSWLAKETQEFIQRRAKEKDPWFCWLNFPDPHEPFVCPEPWYSSVKTDALDLYEGYRSGEFDDRPEFYARLHRGDADQYNDAFGIPSVWGVPRWQEQARSALQATLGMIAFMDDRMGRIMQALEATGQANQTIIVYTSDHGEMHGHHGLWGKGAAAYEDCQRVPLLIWGPKWVHQKGTTDALVNLVDLPRTFLSLAGIPIPQGMQGFDLTPLLKGEVEEVADATIVESHPTTKINQNTLITKRHKLVVYENTEEGELYDLQKDPDQYFNLWSKPDQAGLRARLLQRLAQFHMQKEGAGHSRRAYA